jgi:hypothetical protein
VGGQLDFHCADERSVVARVQLSGTCCKTLPPVRFVVEERSLYVVREPEFGERLYVRGREPIRLPIGVHSPPAGVLWSNLPVHSGVHRSL